MPSAPAGWTSGCFLIENPSFTASASCFAGAVIHCLQAAAERSWERVCGVTVDFASQSLRWILPANRYGSRYRSCRSLPGAYLSYADKKGTKEPGKGETRAPAREAFPFAIPQLLLFRLGEMFRIVG